MSMISNGAFQKNCILVALGLANGDTQLSREADAH